MESPLLPTPPPDYGYLVPLLVALVSILLGVVAYGVKKYLEYRDKRDTDDREFRDKQIAIQEQHYKDVNASRDAFRTSYERNTNERLDGFESTIKAFSGELRAILEEQQRQIHTIDKELHGLKSAIVSQNGQQKTPPKEGG